MCNGGRTGAELIGQAAPLRHHHDAGGRGKQGGDRGRNQIGAQQEHGALRGCPRHDGRTRLGAHHGFQRTLQLLRIRRGMLVQDDQVHRELLQPEILVREQQVPGHVEVGDVADAEQQDRQVAGDALSPTALLAARCRGGWHPTPAAAPARRTPGARPASGTGRRPGAGCRDGAIGPAPASRPASRRDRTRTHRGACRWRRAVPRACPPPSSRTRRVRWRQVRPSRGSAGRTPRPVPCQWCWTTPPRPWRRRCAGFGRGRENGRGRFRPR